MAEKVRVGVIGTSWWTDVAFLSSFASHPAAEMVGICGRTRTRASELAKKYAIPGVFTDYRQMIAAGNLDAIVIATPDDLHYQMTIDALDAGLHVLCEKPLALSVKDAGDMLARAEAAGVKHMVLFTWRWQPHFRYLKQLVDEGYIGRCYQAQFRFLAGFSREPKYTWRQDGLRANGVVSDLGAHMIDFARWYVGEIAQVSALLSEFIAHPGPNDQPSNPNNDAAIVTLKYENGAQGVIQVSVVAHQTVGIEVILHGAAGTLAVNHVFDGPNAGATIRGRHVGEEQLHELAVPVEFSAGLDAENLLDPFVKQAVGPRLFIDAILTDQPVTPNFLDGYKVQQVIEAALASDRQACWIPVA